MQESITGVINVNGLSNTVRRNTDAKLDFNCDEKIASERKGENK